MFRLVLASHGRLAEGMKNSAQFIAGESTAIDTICAYVEEHVTLESQIDEVFGQYSDEDEIVVVTDIFGGSVNNEFLNRLQKQKFWLISGMNLPMIIQLTMIKDSDDICEKVQEAVETGKEMTCFCNPMVEDMTQEKEEF